MANARVWSQQIIEYFPHTSVSGEVWQIIKRGTCTSAGAAGGTTIIDTNGDSGGADTYNGKYFVKILSGACKGEIKRVVDDDGSGTLTLEGNGFSAQIASGVSYEIQLSPDPIVVVDSSSGETDMVDAIRTEADVDDHEFWVGYYACPITGNRRGKKALITAFDPATGTFVLAAGLGGALAAGDVVKLRKFIETADFSIPRGGDAQAYHPRPQVRVNHAVGDGTVGAKSGSVSFSTHIYASGTLAAADAAANQSVLAELMEACGLERSIGSSAAVGAGSNTTAIKIDTGKWENFAVDQMVLWNGNASFITSLEDGGAGVDTVNVSPAFPGTPAAADVLYGTTMFAKSTDSNVYGVGFEVEIDGYRTLLTGCKGNVTLNDGAPPTLAFNFMVDHWVKEYEAEPFSPAYTSSSAILASDRIAYIGTTPTDIKGFTATPGTVFAARNVQGAYGLNGRSSFQLTGYACGATFRELSAESADLTQELRFTARTSFNLAVVMGSHANTFAVRIPAARIIQEPGIENGDGLADVPEVVEAQDAGTSTDGASAVVKVPDFALYLS